MPEVPHYECRRRNPKGPVKDHSQEKNQERGAHRLHGSFGGGYRTTANAAANTTMKNSFSASLKSCDRLPA